MEAHFIWGEEEKVEVEEEEQVEEGDAAAPSSSLPVWGTLEEVLLLQHPVSPRALWVSAALPLQWLPL